MAVLESVVLCFVLTSAVQAIPTLHRERRDAPPVDGDAYLDRYGYTAESKKLGELMSEPPRVAAYKAFQRMAGIPQTGVKDEATTDAMTWPRCGVRDTSANRVGENGKRKKRFALEGSKWDERYPVTYYIQDYTPDLSQDVVDKEIIRAFKVWSDVSKLRFQRVYSRADIIIRFVRGSHGDGNSFDGPGNILAHAFFPRYGGDAHFDEDEIWTFNEHYGKNLFQVAAHEFGHSLGLEHSEEQNSLMAPFYRGFVPNFRLHRDDISGIQALYGQPTSMTPPPGPTDIPTAPPRPTDTQTTRRTTPRPPIPDYCRDGQFDAITNYKNGKTYAFRGDTYYKLGNDGIEEINDISTRLPGVPGFIDSALYWPYNYDGATKLAERLFLFKGNDVWEISSNTLYTGRPISDIFPDLPSNIDASFVWGGNGRTYFIKGDQYYRVSRRGYNGQYRMDSGYPRPLRVWGFSQVDAVFQHDNGRTYFFTGSAYNRFNDYTFAVDNADPPYPRPNDHWWYGCTPQGSIKDSEGMDANDHDQVETVTHQGGDDDSSAGSRVTVTSQSQLVFFAALSLLFYKFR